MDLLFRACLQTHMGVQRAAGLAALQIGIGEASILNLNGISLIPVIAAKHIPVAAEGVNLCVRTEGHQRGLVLARVHPCCVGISDGLQVLVEHGAGVPLEVVAEDVLLPRQKLAELYIGKDVEGDLLSALVRELQLPHQRVIILRHEEL